MFRAAYRSSSETLTVFAASGLRMHVVTGRSQVWVGTSTQTWLRPVTTCVCKPEAANTVRASDEERFNERWINKFYYKVASYWLFLLSHITMHGSMNIKKTMIGESKIGRLRQKSKVHFSFFTYIHTVHLDTIKVLFTNWCTIQLS